VPARLVPLTGEGRSDIRSEARSDIVVKKSA
jgi:hypothetical protein